MGQLINNKKVILSNGESIFYRDSGAGEVLVLLHGNMTSSFHLINFIQSLPDNIRVIAPDMRGFGQSSYLRSINSLTELSNDLNELLKQLNINHYAIAGWSMGGGIAMQHAIDYKDNVTKLMLISSVATTGYPLKGNAGQGEYLTSKQAIAEDPMLAPVINAFSEQNTAFIQAVWDMAVYNHKKPNETEYPALLEDVLTQVNINDIYYALSYFNITDTHNGIIKGSNLINNIEAPVLILHGEDDLVIPLINARQTQDLLLTLNKSVEIYTYPDSGHSLFIDQPEQLAQQVLTFLHS